MVEDAPAGIQAARAAGMTVVGLTTTHRVDQLGADACAESLAGVHLGRVDRDGAGRDRGWRSWSSSPTQRFAGTRDSSSSVRAPPARIAPTSS